MRSEKSRGTITRPPTVHAHSGVKIARFLVTAKRYPTAATCWMMKSQWRSIGHVCQSRSACFRVEMKLSSKFYTSKTASSSLPCFWKYTVVFSIAFSFWMN